MSETSPLGKMRTVRTTLGVREGVDPVPATVPVGGRVSLKGRLDDSSHRGPRGDEGGSTLSLIRRFDHVGITVADLDAVTTFFVGLGFEVEGRMPMEGEFVDTVIGLPNSRSEIVMLRPPGGGTGLELSSFVQPSHEPGSPEAMSNELGLRNVAFEVDDLQQIIDRLATEGYGLVGGVGQYEEMWRMAYVRGPEGIIVSLAQRID
jgi:catechol 2,3-dioxygenase-like lactoylglutathione lyase family enzyme